MTRNLGRVKAQGFQRLGRWRVGWRGRGAEGLMFCVVGGGITEDVYGGRDLVTCCCYFHGKADHLQKGDPGSQEDF